MIHSYDDLVALLTSSDRSINQSALIEEAPAFVWLEIIEAYPELRGIIAQNKTIPDAVIDILSRDQDSRIRGWIAMKRKTPPEVLARLAQDDSDGVRRSVVYNVKTPDAVLELLLEDSMPDISAKAAQRLTKIRE